MSIFNCINKAEKKGIITKDEAKELTDEYLKIDPSAKSKGSTASPELSKAFLKQKVDNARIKKYQAAKQTLRDIENFKIISSHPKDAIRGLASLLSRDFIDGDFKMGNTNIDSRVHAVLGDMYSVWGEAVERFRTKNLGFSQDTDGLEKLVRAIFEESVDDPNISAFAKAWEVIVEHTRQRFNLGGGAIRKRNKWRVPQSHDSDKVRKATFEEWSDFITPRLNREEMIDFRTGLPMSDDRLQEILQKSYDNIRTDGLASEIPGKGISRRLANLHSDPRVLVFKDADSWLEYHKAFGGDDIFSGMNSYLNKMAHEIALIEVLGPNPEGAYQKLKTLAKQDAVAKGTDKDSMTQLRFSRLDGLWDVVSGKTDEVKVDKLADISLTFRSLMVSAKLGSAFLSAMGDIGFSASARLFNGLPVMGQISGTLKLMNPKNKADRIFASHMGLGVEAATSKALASARFFGEQEAPANLMGKISEGVMRASLLSSWTDASKKAFSLDFYKNLADLRKSTFDKLPEKVSDGFKRYGITERDWDFLRHSKVEGFEGNSYLRAGNLKDIEGLDATERVNMITKFQEMVQTESSLAIPVPDANSKVVLTFGGLQKGTFAGEATRTVAIFKSFPVTVIMNQLGRMGVYSLMKGNSGTLRGQYLGAALVSTTVMGAFALQLKNISKGLDPEEMDTPEFWERAFIQGGGAGIYGDFIHAGLSGKNRYGRGMVETLIGPVVDFADDATSLTLGNVGQLIAGEDTNFGQELVKFGTKNLPANNLWYTRIGFERLIKDNLMAMTNERKARQSWRRIESKRLRERGQRSWWRAGELAPERFPEL